MPQAELRQLVTIKWQHQRHENISVKSMNSLLWRRRIILQKRNVQTECFVVGTRDKELWIRWLKIHIGAVERNRKTTFTNLARLASSTAHGDFAVLKLNNPLSACRINFSAQRRGNVAGIRYFSGNTTLRVGVVHTGGNGCGDFV